MTGVASAEWYAAVCFRSAILACFAKRCSRLNAAPFNCDLSLVGFDEKAGVFVKSRIDHVKTKKQESERERERETERESAGVDLNER